MAKVHIPYSEATTNFNNTKALSIDEANRNKLIYMVTEAPYKNPLGTVVREYLSNALDEHVSMDIDRPIDIFTPNTLDSTLTIRDYCRGMDREFIENVFCSFGCTTKENSDKAIGGWGVGGKSFAALTDEILISTIHNGTKIVFTMYKDKDISIGYNILSETITEESNGTTVRIYIDKNQHTKCIEEVAYWTEYLPKPVNIQPPLEASHSSYKHVDNTIVTTGSNWKILRANNYYKGYGYQGECGYRNLIVVLIGGLKYSINSLNVLFTENNPYLTEDDISVLKALGTSYLLGYQIIINFDPGVLDLTVGREDLRFSEKTINILSKELNKVLSEIRESLTNITNAKDNIWQASLFSSILTRTFSIKYKGLKLLSCSPSIKNLYEVTLSCDNRVIKKEQPYIKTSNKNPYIVYDDLLEVDPNLSNNKRVRSLNSRLRRFFNDNNLTYIYLIGEGNDIKDDWKEMLDPVMVSTLPLSEKKVRVKKKGAKSNNSSNTTNRQLKPSNDNLIVVRKWLGNYCTDSMNLWKYCKPVEIDPKSIKAFYLITNRGSLKNKKGELTIDFSKEFKKLSIIEENIVQASFDIARTLKGYKEYKDLFLIKENQRDKLIKEGAGLIEFTDFIKTVTVDIIALGQCIEKSNCIEIYFVQFLKELGDKYKFSVNLYPDWLKFYIELTERIESVKSKTHYIVQKSGVYIYRKAKPINCDNLIFNTFKRVGKLSIFNLLIRHDNSYNKRFDQILYKYVDTPKKFKDFIELLDFDFKQRTQKIPFDGDVNKYIDYLLEIASLHNEALEYIKN